MGTVSSNCDADVVSDEKVLEIFSHSLSINRWRNVKIQVYQEILKNASDPKLEADMKACQALVQKDYQSFFDLLLRWKGKKGKNDANR